MARTLNKAWWVLTVVFAAIQMVVTLFPTNIPITGTGIYFSIDLISFPVIGYLLGPSYGTVSVLFGTFMGAVINPSAAGMMMYFGVIGAFLSAIPPTIGAFVAGLIRNGRHRMVPLVLIVAIALFLFTPIGLASFSFLWLHIITLSLSLLFLVSQLKSHLRDGLNLSEGTSYPQAAIAMLLLVFISVMADHIVASVMRAYLLLSVAPEYSYFIYTDVIFIYPIERILASIVGALVTLLIAVGIARVNLYLPTRPIEGRGADSTELLDEEVLARPRDIEEMTPPEEDA